MANVLGKGSDDTITRKPRKKGVVISCKMDGKCNHETTKIPEEKPGHRQTELTALIVRAAKTAPILARPFVLHALKRDSPLSVTGFTGCPGLL
jgi:hypothetical protein